MYVIIQTYMQKKIKDTVSKEIQPKEALSYIFILLFASIINLPQLEMLWSNNEYYSTIISKIMTLYRFRKIQNTFT